MNLRQGMCLAVIMTISLTAQAQEKGDTVKTTERGKRASIERVMANNHILGVGGSENRDSLSRLLNIFYYDQFRHSQDPRSPYFMFLSRKAAISAKGMISFRS